MPIHKTGMFKIKYIPKSYDNLNEPWIVFGAPSKNEYEKWSPEICGICCLKMIGDTLGFTTSVSLYQLTTECKQKGGFKELPSGEIQGIFHKPLLELAKDYGLEGSVEGDLPIKKIITSLKSNRFIILSIDKSKVDPKLRGGHLVLVYAYDPKSKTFFLHDPEPLLAQNGQNVKIDSSKLEKISNKKGLIIWYSSFSQLTPVDQYLTIFLFNERKKNYPTGLVHELFETQARKNPKAVAVVYRDQKITYGKLDQTANQLANYLIEKGVRSESFVGISVDRSLEMIVSVLATLKAGAAYIPIEPSFPPDLVKFMINDSSPAAIITSSEHAPKFERKRTTVIKLDDEAKAIKMQSINKPDVGITESSIAYAIYTSGSTGKRKAALIEHKSIVNQCYAWQDVYQINGQDGVLQTASFSFDVFTGDWTRTLAAGAKLVLNPYNLILSPDDSKTGEDLYHLMKDNGVTVAEFTPPVLRKLMRYARNTGESLGFMRLIIVGADAWYMNEHRELVEFTKGQCRIIDSYGMTEATVDSTYYEGYGKENSSDISLIGKPFTNTEIYILDSKNNVVPVGKKGELCVAGPGLTRGYLNRPDLNTERFGEIIFPDGSAKRIYRSGDLARFRHDGNLEFFGRIDNQVELGAIRVEIGEIEGVIQKHPAVQENSIIVIGDKDHNKKVVCFMVNNPRQSITNSELRKFLADKLPSYMWPSQIHILDSMPLTLAGKIDKQKLASLVNK